MEELDLSKPFFRTWREGNLIKWEKNAPNDEVGDFAFEYDFDGSERKKWQEYIQELKDKGTLGQLVYSTGSMVYNPVFDTPQTNVALSSAKFIIFDISKDNG